MPTINTLTPSPEAAPEPTAAELIAQQVVSDSDLALKRLANSVQRGFELVWGTKESPREKQDIQDTVNALGSELSPVFARHAAMIAALESSGMVTFEPWEKVTAYPIAEDGTLGEMNPEWL